MEEDYLRQELEVLHQKHVQQFCARGTLTMGFFGGVYGIGGLIRTFYPMFSDNPKSQATCSGFGTVLLQKFS